MTKDKNNIPPYEHLFTENSLERAYEYIDCIDDVELSRNSISCRVEGTYRYKVKIEWDEDDYTELSCSCPYDYEGYCKHIAAVLMYLEDELDYIEDVEYVDEIDDSNGKIDVAHTSNKKPKKPEWQETVESLSKEELQSLVIEYAEDNDYLINTIMVKHSKSSDKVNIKKQRKIVDKIFDSVSEDFGFISYYNLNRVADLVYHLINKATLFKDKKAFNEAFSISAAIAESCVEYIQYADDSDGTIGDLIWDSFDLVSDIFNECKDEKLRNLIFEWLTQQMNNPDYRNYGCGDALSDVYFDLGSNELYVDSVFQFLDKQLDKYKNGNDWSAKYRYESLLCEKLTLLTKVGKKDEAQLLIESNLRFHDIRKVKVNQLLEQKEFSEAINCIKEGINISDQESHYGSTTEWNNLLLQIYENQGYIDELRKLAKEMIFGNRNVMKYYLLLKKHNESTKWNEERMSIIQKIKSKASKLYFSGNLASIYIEEEMWSELLFEVEKSNNISVTSQYSKYLSDIYPNELIAIYRSSILKLGEQTGRKYYEEIKSYLKEMSRLKDGLKSAKALKEELLSTYKNRPAMKQILEPLFR